MWKLGWTIDQQGWLDAPSGKVDLFLENPNCNLIRVASLQATRQPLCRREMHCAVCNAHEGPSRQ